MGSKRPFTDPHTARKTPPALTTYNRHRVCIGGVGEGVRKLPDVWGGEGGRKRRRGRGGEEEGYLWVVIAVHFCDFLEEGASVTGKVFEALRWKRGGGEGG